MPGAVVDQLEAVQIQEQQREQVRVVVLRRLYRRLQPIQQLGAVGQPGQRVVAGLVGQLLLGAQALADLRQQFDVGLGQLTRSRGDALFQLGMRADQPVLRLLSRQPDADMVRDEGQQFLVALVEHHRRRIALYRDHANHGVLPEKRHAQPAMRTCPLHPHDALRLQRIHLPVIGQQGASAGDHIFG